MGSLMHIPKPKRIARGFWLLAMIIPTWAHAAVFQTVNLNSALTDTLKDNTGVDLDSSFDASLGSFDGGFDPTKFNTADWSSNWRVFDQTTITLVPPGTENQVPQFQMSADLLDTGLTNSTASQADLDYNFSGLDIWLWVKNGENIQAEGTEWFLARVASWTFATVSAGGCCPGADPLDLAISDFSNELPVWGSQGDQLQGYKGAGFYEFNDETGQFEVQTYKVIPEPGSLFLSAITLLLCGWFGFSRKGDHS